MRMIDADSLKEQMLAETPEHEKGVVDIFLEAVATMIDEQPTIEERKTGKWIRGDAEKLTGSQRCSICHKACYKGKDSFNYCPNCGAEMDCQGD